MPPSHFQRALCLLPVPFGMTKRRAAAARIDVAITSNLTAAQMARMTVRCGGNDDRTHPLPLVARQR